MHHLRVFQSQMPDFTTQYNTVLTPADEAKFQNWLALKSPQLGRPLVKDLADYDLRGYWLSGAWADNQSGLHLPDKFKKPNHPTFSDESIYHGAIAPWGGKFQGGKWVGNDTDGWVFQPSSAMLKYTHDKDALRQYFADFEPNAGLSMPTQNVVPK